mgnify:CR=1 FL=1
MHTIKKEVIHITTDNHRFNNIEDAREWQSVLDMKKLNLWR